MVHNPYDAPKQACATDAMPLGVPRRWLLCSWLLTVLGLVGIFAGWMYGVLLVGVPDQDATVEAARRQAQHLGISSWIVGIGGMLLVSGIVLVMWMLIALPASRIVWRCRKQ